MLLYSYVLFHIHEFDRFLKERSSGFAKSASKGTSLQIKSP